MPLGPKLRARPVTDPFHVVLVEPEIPPNTGAVARTCAATGSPLHLVGRLGFQIDAQSVRRAGLDYWHLVDLRRHDDLASLAAELPITRWHLFSSGASRSLFEVDFQLGDALVFGKESVGLPPELLDAHPDRTVGIPTLGSVRSLNLSNAVSIAVYEALRRRSAFRSTFIE